MALSNSIYKEGEWERGGKKPKPQSRGNLAPFGQMVRAEPSWIGYWPNWNHICVLFSSDARAGWLAGAGEKSPSAKMRRCENPPEGSEGFQHLPGCRCCCPGVRCGQLVAAAALRLPFLGGNDHGERIPPNSVAEAWENTLPLSS